MERFLFLIIYLLSFCKFAFTKPKSEIQLGPSYNTLKSTVYSGRYPQILNYNRLTARPIVRLFLTSKSKWNISFGTFLGYHVMGGRFKSDTSKYKESIYRHSLEFGILPTYNIMKIVQIGIGAKFNINPISFYRHYGTVNQSNDLSREWVAENVTTRYRKYSSNIGFTIKHQYNKLSFSFEAWFGFTNFGNMNSTTYRSETTEKNYRLLVGYRLTKKKTIKKVQ